MPDTLATLHVNPETGLAHREVETRRTEHGYNEVAEQEEHPIRKFLGKFWLATDRVRPSRKPETWNIGGFITVSVVLGVMMVAEALLFLYFCWSSFDLAPIDGVKDKPLHTFSFLILLYFAVFSVASAHERRWFWATMPSKSLIAALTADALVGTVVALVGLPGLAPLA